VILLSYYLGYSGFVEDEVYAYRGFGFSIYNIITKSRPKLVLDTVKSSWEPPLYLTQYDFGKSNKEIYSNTEWNDVYQLHDAHSVANGYNGLIFEVKVISKSKIASYFIRIEKHHQYLKSIAILER
jgi:hypothetical protein